MRSRRSGSEGDWPARTEGGRKRGSTHSSDREKKKYLAQVRCQASPREGRSNIGRGARNFFWEKEKPLKPSIEGGRHVHRFLGSARVKVKKRVEGPYQEEKVRKPSIFPRRRGEVPNRAVPP